MPTYTLIHATPTDSKHPSAVHFNTGKSVKFWKNAFKTLYVDQLGLKRTDFDVREVCKCYKKQNAVIQAQGYAAEHECLVFTKEHRKPAVWRKVAQKRKQEKDFEYYSLCCDRKFEPLFIPFCHRLTNLKKQSEAVPIVANFLVKLRIPVPRLKIRRQAFTTMFALPRKTGDEPRCAFQMTRSVCSSVLVFDMDHARHKFTGNGSRLPDWTDEEDRDFEKRGDMIFSIVDFFELWRKTTLVNKICAEMNKVYADQRGPTELAVAEDAVQVV